MTFRVTILGCSSALPHPHRHHSGQVVDVHEQYFLVDCGEGTQYQLARYVPNSAKINHLFISHLHGDHCYGVFGLLSSLSMQGRARALTIYAPAPFREMLESHFRFFGIELAFPLEVVEIDPRKHLKIFENRILEVWTLPLRHRVPTSGYLFREKSPGLNVRKEAIERYGLDLAQIAAAKRGEPVALDDGRVLANDQIAYLPYAPRSYAYCSDTTPSGKVAGLVQGVDLLYHEATFLHVEKALALKTGHTTAKQAGRLAAKAGAGHLLIGHYSLRYKESDRLLAEAQAEFPRSHAAEDGLQIEVLKEDHSLKITAKR